jgi:hypothetical protein
MFMKDCDACEWFEERVGVLMGGKVKAERICKLTNKPIENIFEGCCYWKPTKTEEMGE